MKTLVVSHEMMQSLMELCYSESEFYRKEDAAALSKEYLGLSDQCAAILQGGPMEQYVITIERRI